MSDSASRARLARAAARLGSVANLVLFTDDERLADPIAAASVLPRGSLVIIRSRQASRRQTLALALKKTARTRRLLLLVAGDVALARRIGADGVHLPEERIGEAAAVRARHPFLVTAAAHSPAALRRAAAVDALILSAVFPTASHPDRPALGAVRANFIALVAPKPVYALGGITAANAGRLHGFCGLAAIGALAV